MNTPALRGSLRMAICLVSLARMVSGAPILNYQGRITAEGSDFNGTGAFKFALVNGANETVWVNDGSDGQPATPVWLSVSNGLFSVDLGRDMFPIPPIALQEPDLTLRVWFSDGSGFEQLTPDIAVNPVDFSQINTGSMLVVDKDQRGDFSSLQAAVDCVASNDAFTTILLMPGVYNESVVLPPDRHLTIRGAADASVVNVESGGTALLFGDRTVAHLENISLSGSPAISDSGLADWGQIALKNCEVLLSQPGGNNASISLTTQGNLNLSFCAVYNYFTGAAMEIAGDPRLEAEHSRLEADSGPPLAVSSGNADLSFESCSLFSQSDTAVSVTECSGRFTFRQCHFGSGLAITNSPAYGTFENCNIENALIVRDASQEGGLDFSGCDFGYSEDMNRVRIVGGTPNLRFDSCALHSVNQSTLYLEDAPGWIELKNCRIQTENASAVEMIGTENLTSSGINDFDLEIRNSSISGWRSEPTATNAAVRVANASDAAMEIDIVMSDIMGDAGDGIAVNGAVELFVSGSDIEGERHGIYAPDGCEEIDLENCLVEGMTGNALHLGGPGFVSIRNGDFWSDENSGIYLDPGAPGVAVILQSLIGSWSKAGLEIVSGTNTLCNHSTMISGSDATAKLAGPGTAVRFNHCAFKSIASFEGAANPNPAVVLSGSQDATPSPLFFSCSFEPDDVAANSIALDGGATSAEITLIHSLLQKPVQSGIANVAPAADAYGNVVLP